MAEDFYSQIYKGNNLVRKLFKNGEQVLKVYKHNTKVYEWIGDTPQEEYTFVEYIYSENGVGYFNTSYIPTSNTKVEMKVSRGGSGYPYFAGRVAAQNKDFGVYPREIVYAQNQVLSDYGNTRQTINIQNNDTDTYTIQHSKEGTYYNGTKVSSAFTDNVDFEIPIAILASNSNGTYNLKNALFAKIYHFKIWEDGELVRSWKPAIRNADNKTGLYDEVNDTFIEPIEGNFICPSTNVYAKFDGASYFNTNVTISSGTQNFRVMCGVYLENKPTTTVCPFGMRYSSYSFMPLHTNAADGWRMNLGSNMTISAMTTEDNTEYEIDMNISGGATSKTSAFEIFDKKNLKAAYTRQTSRTYNSSLNSRPMWVGAMNDSQNTPSYFNQYIKYVRVYRNNSLINNFVFKEVDGVVKMYDKVNDKYYDNLGTGQITLVDINKLNV